MDRISVTLPSDQLIRIDDRVGSEYESRSEAVRALVERGFEYDDLEAENERLQRRVRALIEQRDEHDELVAYVEDERLDRQRERERRQANILRRAWWKLAGVPEDETAD